MKSLNDDRYLWSQQDNEDSGSGEAGPYCCWFFGCCWLFDMAQPGLEQPATG